MSDKTLKYFDSTVHVLHFTVVEYKVADMGFLRYYLAPKIEDQDGDWRHEQTE